MAHIPDHPAEHVGQCCAQQKHREELQQVGQRRGVEVRRRDVRRDETATVDAELLDDRLRRHRSAGDRLVRALERRAGRVRCKILRRSLPNQLLNEMHAAGGAARPSELYDRIAERIGLDDATRNRTVKTTGDREFRIFDRSVRWTRQTAVAKGLIEGRERGRWELTDRANAKLQNIVAGAIVTVFETASGIAIWATCESAVGLIERNSVSLILTSPPYPLIKEKNYGNRGASEWVEWMLRLCAGWREVLTEDGSLMLNLGTCWVPGVPAQSIYMERLLVRLEDALGLHLCQRLDWHSPTKLPAPMEWVSVRRIRVKPSVEPTVQLRSIVFSQ
jgi:site-specific DNA-methyltransferase (cytosine-N4-specific)